MYNTMNGVNVADKLKLDPEVRELKFGSSFTSGGRNQQQGSFHSVRYDFKPASVDTSKMATLDVGPNGQVTISMPNVDGNGTTVFKGARKPYAKECVLIIDHETGEVVLEKLTHNIQVKRTREEGGCKKGGSSSLSMPVVPPPPAVEAKKPPHPSSFKMDPKITNNRERDDSKKPLLSVPSTSQMQHQQPNANKRGPNNSPKPPPPQQQQRQSPNNRPSPGHSVSPPLALSPPSPHPAPAYDSHRSNLSKQSQSQQNSILSLTNFEDLLSMAPPPPQAKAKVDKRYHRRHHHKRKSFRIFPQQCTSQRWLALLPQKVTMYLHYRNLLVGRTAVVVLVVTKMMIVATIWRMCLIRCRFQL
ncbi:Ell-associated factor Eaf [Orchesella cincta]|uniref:Ell-associated factor Eaf n=1 Tax=Orchesella cincta TaxID=48709 RepID=A0A1D2NKV7_ORCCI|nr:Ell-associated factor Eaf [Orchesella cincta]